MKVLFDNNVPAPVARHLADHEVRTARSMRWHELENGDLLRAAEQSGFEIMVTADQNLSYQQNLTGRKLAIVVLSTNDWSVIRQAYRIGSPRRRRFNTRELPGREIQSIIPPFTYNGERTTDNAIPKRDVSPSTDYSFP